MALMDQNIWISPTQAKDYGLIDEIVGLPGNEEDPAAFVAAVGGRIRLTASMREQYQAYIVGQRAEEVRQKQVRRTLARLRALAEF